MADKADRRLDGRVVIVLDILFATTTIVTALDAGAAAVHFAEDQHEARRIAARLPGGGYHIAGEDHLASIPGFASPLPLELSRRAGFAGKPLVYSTTNGTVALRRSQGAAAVLRHRCATRRQRSRTSRSIMPARRSSSSARDRPAR